MQSIQIKENPVEYDVVIVGSGAGGGMVTNMLGNAGLKVCLLEAGPMYDPKKILHNLNGTGSRPVGELAPKSGHLEIWMPVSVVGK